MITDTQAEESFHPLTPALWPPGLGRLSFFHSRRHSLLCSTAQLLPGTGFLLMPVPLWDRARSWALVCPVKIAKTCWVGNLCQVLFQALCISLYFLILVGNPVRQVLFCHYSTIQRRKHRKFKWLGSKTYSERSQDLNVHSGRSKN